ncbi:unnamed protein product [Mycena citricolor]|uniref:Uncharacterized protein n=1 Tax=Mycena citricolor TaxID=2018698 RepID=A0AAD2H0R9_9AGAR|nr:unnamed protein product [Mycena citricolor]
MSGGPSAELLVYLDELEDSHSALSDQADVLVLYRLINRLNSLCERLENEMPPHSLLPLPTQLSTKLSVLKADQSLFEDVCVLPTGNKIPRWLDDSDVRDGIQSMHSLDRCREELARLNLERENLQNVLEEERLICHQCLHTTKDPTLIYLLNVHMDQILLLTEHWQPSFKNYTMHTSSGGQITLSDRAKASASNLFSQHHRANASAPLPVVEADASADNPFLTDASAQSQGNMQVAPSAPSAYLHLPTSLEDVEDEVLDGFTDIEDINLALEVLNVTESDDTTIPDEGSVQIHIRWDLPLIELKYDLGLFSELQARNNRLSKSSAQLSHIIVRGGSLPNIIIEPADLARIIDHHGLLSGQCINGVAASFQALFLHVHSPHHLAAC